MEAYRSFLYQFLSSAFSYPEEETLEKLEASLGDLKRALQGLQIRYDAASLRPVLRQARERLLDLQGEHNSLFATSVKAPAWETAYELDKTARRAVELADIEGFYRAFGLNLTAPIEPDSLIAELEFLAVLLQKQLYALDVGNQEGVDICAEAHRKFLTDHLGRWCEVFVHRLAEASDDPYYRRIGGLLKVFVDKETEGLQIPKLSEYPVETLQASTWECDVQTGPGG
ncbi:MAG: molecular chaperone [Candidatus Methylomirabilales bacterium]